MLIEILAAVDVLEVIILFKFNNVLFKAVLANEHFLAQFAFSIWVEVGCLDSADFFFYHPDDQFLYVDIVLPGKGVSVGEED